MRLSPNTIRNALLHPDRDVRDLALRYFATNEGGAGTDIMARVIQALERYGRTEAFELDDKISLLPLTEETVVWVVAELGRDFPGRPEEAYHYHQILSQLLSHVHVQVVQRHAVAIAQARHLAPEARAALDEWHAMTDWDAARCWQELWQLCDASKDCTQGEDFPLSRALMIVEALGRHPEECRQPALDLLAEPVIATGSDARKWILPLIVCLAGDLRWPEAVPLLLRHLAHPYQYLGEQCILTLAHYGTDEVVAAVGESFPRSNLEYRLRASRLFEKIRRDSAIQQVLQLLPGETNPDVRLSLCEALLHQFSPAGVEPARQIIQQLIRQQPVPPPLRQLRRSLVAACQVMGVKFPEFAAWRRDAARDAQVSWTSRQHIQRLTFEAGGDSKLFAQKMKAHIIELQKENARLKAVIAQSEAAVRLLSAAQRRPDQSEPEPERVGRNDPCPCGSGKKFKHCCRNS